MGQDVGLRLRLGIALTDWRQRGGSPSGGRAKRSTFAFEDATSRVFRMIRLPELSVGQI